MVFLKLYKTVIILKHSRVKISFAIDINETDVIGAETIVLPMSDSVHLQQWPSINIVVFSPALHLVVLHFTEL